MINKDYDIIQTKEGISLTGKAAAQIKRFNFVEGLCAADPKTPLKPRETRWYLDTVITPLLQQGKIDDGTKTLFDDRKFRLHTIGLQDDTLEIALGVSYFSAYLEDQERSDEENLFLQEKGLRDFHDKWAYFQRNPGVAGLVLSSTGSAYIGKRANLEGLGKLNSVAGHMDYKENMYEVDVRANLQNEMTEEMGITSDEVISAKFVGAYGHPIKGAMDFAWIVRTSLPDTYFSPQGAWKERRKIEEHQDLIKLATPAEIKMLLWEGRLPGKNEMFQIKYSTRGALENLIEDTFQ